MGTFSIKRAGEPSIRLQEVSKSQEPPSEDRAGSWRRVAVVSVERTWGKVMVFELRRGSKANTLVEKHDPVTSDASMVNYGIGGTHYTTEARQEQHYDKEQVPAIVSKIITRKENSFILRVGRRSEMFQTVTKIRGMKLLLLFGNYSMVPAENNVLTLPALEWLLPSSPTSMLTLPRPPPLALF